MIKQSEGKTVNVLWLNSFMINVTIIIYVYVSLTILTGMKDTLSADKYTVSSDEWTQSISDKQVD